MPAGPYVQKMLKYLPKGSSFVMGSSQLVVMNDEDKLIEIQGTAEDVPFSKNELDDMLELGSSAIAELIKKQKACIE